MANKPAGSEVVQEGWTALSDTWATFSQNVERNLVSNIYQQQEEYRELCSQWMDMSRNIGQVVCGAQGEQGRSDEVMAVWMSYSRTLNNRLNKVVDIGNFAMTELEGHWRDHIARMQSGFLNGCGGAGGEPGELYDRWQTLFRRFSGELSRLDAGKRVQMDEFRTILKECNREMMNAIAARTQMDAELRRRLLETWTAAFNQLHQVVMESLKEDAAGCETMFRAWLQESTKVTMTIQGIMERRGAACMDVYGDQMRFGSDMANIAFIGRPGHLAQLEDEVCRLRERLAGLEPKLPEGKEGSG